MQLTVLHPKHKNTIARNMPAILVPSDFVSVSHVDWRGQYPAHALVRFGTSRHPDGDNVQMVAASLERVSRERR